MKKRRISIFVAALTLTLFLPNTFSQEQAKDKAELKTKTKIEEFQAQTGSVIIKGYSDIGKITALGTIDVTAMEFTDATTSRKQLGIMIDVKESGRYENKNRAFIDYEEIDALLKGLDYIEKASSNVTKLNMFEATYKTTGYFAVTTFSRKNGKVDVGVKCGYIHTSNVFLSLKQLSSLRLLLMKAKEKLDSIQ